MPNADTGGREIIERVKQFVSARGNTAAAFTSLGQLRYLSCLRHVDAVVGNSSSGLLEAPSFGIATVDIGDRQRGRLRADSVICCAPERAAIVSAIQHALSPEFQPRLNLVNPYGTGGASEKVVEVLKTWPLAATVKKRFYDLPGV